jgi:predicted O-methyltransferase YrrM
MNLPLFDTSKLTVPHFTGDTVMMTALERNMVVALANSVKARVVVEIGVHEGRMARRLLRDVSTIERYVGVDVLPGYVPSLSVQKTEIPKEPAYFVKGDPRFELVLRGHGSLDLMQSELPRCDLVLIDGDHGREAVTHDSALARAIVRRGGLIVWHDYYIGSDACQVRDVLNEMRGRAIGRIQDTWLAVERR